MIIRTFAPDYAYLPEWMQRDPFELVGVTAELRGEEVKAFVPDSPYLVASALEGIAAAIRKKWTI